MASQLPLHIGLGDYARFENFYAGPNRELLDTLQGFAAGSDERFCFLAGAFGSGKSHLLQACCAAVGGRAVYLPLSAIHQPTPDLLDDLEQMSLVCLDDIDGICGQPDWEEALFDLYNRIREAGGRLLVAAEGLPQALGIRLPDLVSRLRWGLVYQLRPMDDGERLAALQLRARLRGFELPDDTGQYLLRRMPRDLPALFELLDHLDQASLVAKRRLTIPFVRTVLPKGAS